MSNKLSKNQQISVYRSYLRSDEYNLDQAYGRYSNAKAQAWRYCETLMCEKHGWALKVIGHNSCTFSAGFEFVNPETGEVMFMYITRDYDREFPVPAEVDYE